MLYWGLGDRLKKIGFKCPHIDFVHGMSLISGLIVGNAEIVYLSRRNR